MCTFFRFTFLSFSCLCFSTDFNNLLRFVHEKYFIWKFLDLKECTYMHRENVRHFSSKFWALLCFFRFCSVLQSEWKMNFHSASSSSCETLSLGSIKCRSNSCFQRTETSVTRGCCKNCRNLSNVMGNVGFSQKELAD